MNKTEELIMSEELDKRLDELLEEMHNTQAGTKEYDALVKEFLILNKAKVDAFKASSDDVNNNNKNRVEKLKAIVDPASKVLIAIIGFIGTMNVANNLDKIEEFGAVTTKKFNLLPKLIKF